MAPYQRKKYVLDKSVILFSPYSILAFDDNEVYLMQSVIRELEHVAAEGRGEERANAKEFGIIMDELAESGYSRIIDVNGLACESFTIDLESGGCINIIGSPLAETLMHPIDFASRNKLTLVTRDTFMRVEARAQGIAVEDYKSDQVPEGGKAYEGRCKLFISPEEMETFAGEKRLELLQPSYAAVRMDGETLISDDYKLTTNEYVVLLDASNPRHTMLGRFDGTAILPLLYYPGKAAGKVYGVEPRNVGQIFALDALLAPPDVAPLVILQGPAGTAKTFLSAAAALAQTIDSWGGSEGTHYRKILLTRPNTKMDDDIGYLKGSETDKVLPALRGLIDNIDNLAAGTKHYEDEQKDGTPVGSMLDSLLALGKIDAQALAYMRGRSISNQYIICDEMQNATIMQTLSIVTRAGKNSKIVLCGDPDQIDHPMLDKRTNGISFASLRMRGSHTCWQLSFVEEECERSPLAAEAIARMKPKGAI